MSHTFSVEAVLTILLKLQINNRGFAIEIVSALLGTPERQAGGESYRFNKLPPQNHFFLEEKNIKVS